MYCFDTDILAAALLREPPMQLVRRLARVPGDKQCTTAVSVAEITYAAARNGDGEVAGRVHDLIAAANTVLPFDHEAANVYGPLRMRLERLGIRLDETSLRIASIALAHDLTLVTGSARLYGRVPDLRIEDWLAPDGHDLEDEPEGVEPPEPDDIELDDPGNGSVRHPGFVLSLDARAQAAADPEASTDAP